MCWNSGFDYVNMRREKHVVNGDSRRATPVWQHVNGRKFRKFSIFLFKSILANHHIKSVLWSVFVWICMFGLKMGKTQTLKHVEKVKIVRQIFDVL